MEGIDMIKPEYVITDHERVLSLDCVSDKDKVQLDETEPSEGAAAKQESSEKDQKGSKNDGKWKKKKLKGQNKHRATFRVPDEKQLCSKVLYKGEDLTEGCNNKRCRYLHSVKDYLKVKEPDIGDSCYVFNTKGKCPWGVACRFATSHLDEDGNNIEKPEVAAEFQKDKSLQSLNRIPFEKIVELRKRKYDFSKTSEVINAVDKVFKRENEKNPEDEEEEACKRSADDCPDGDLPNKKLKDECGSAIPAPLSSSNGDNDAKPQVQTCGPVDDLDLIKLRLPEKKKIDWADKLYLAPLTTLGNLPFRRICKEYGADVTCGEMALATSLLKGDAKEWSLVKRHASEDLYGVQIAASNPFQLSRASQALQEMCELDFIDINLGCPIDELYRQGVGSGMLQRPRLLKHTATSLNYLLDIPYTFKVRMGCKKPVVHNYMSWMKESGLSMITVHGRSREQRYTRNADWEYIEDCAKRASPVPIFGNGDILSYQDYDRVRTQCPTVQGVMIGRGALMKPWLFQEIKERRIMDPTSSERLDMLKKFVHYGLDHWGSDNRGVENTRRFLLEWLSFLHRYVPSGLLTKPPQVMNQRPPFYRGRDDLETRMASPNAQDWVKISEMLLGAVPDGFVFLPKHKANAWK
ncbi:hypothetical protein GE061_007837 [Apolygus lucorum]|uniref:tRNA-dihydrouridine(47) synthase [NAD(P)(+)] n=1 Tax=Apolygus lucorum TaxID=248454 RepID=A0A8S9WLW4_APOLU|nr:hypothetical protein GE061_007837 [Apolygus lucorum]